MPYRVPNALILARHLRVRMGAQRVGIGRGRRYALGAAGRLARRERRRLRGAGRAEAVHAGGEGTPAAHGAEAAATEHERTAQIRFRRMCIYRENQLPLYDNI